MAQPLKMKVLGKTIPDKEPPKKRRHVVVLPLDVNTREAHILNGQLRLVGKLRNAALGSLIPRVEAMRSDSDWQRAGAISPGKARSTLYRELRERHQLRGFDVNACVFGHWQRSKWMTTRLGSRIAYALGPELAQNLDEWIYGRSECPGYKRADARDVVWNNDDESGLVYDAASGNVCWSINTKRKSLELPVDFGGWSNHRRTWLQGQRVVRCGIRRELIQGRVRYSVLLCVAAFPYRNREYLASVQDGFQGIDLGPSEVAVVGENRSAVYRLLSPEQEEQRQEQASRQRRVQRASARSRKAANVHAFRKNGRSVKGVKQPQRSKRGRQRQQQAADLARVNTIHRQQDWAALVKKIVAGGREVAGEALCIKSWQRGLFGKQVSINAPATLIEDLRRECLIVGGHYTELDTPSLALSQRCICGDKRKKEADEEARGKNDFANLSVREHHCPVCDLGPIHRDLFSADLAREALIRGQQQFLKSLGSPSFTTIGVRERIERLCALKPRRTGEPSRTSRRGCATVKTTSGSPTAALVGSYSGSCANAVGEPKSVQSDPRTIKPGGGSGSSRRTPPHNLSGVAASSKATSADHATLVSMQARAVASVLGTQGDMPFREREEAYHQQRQYARPPDTHGCATAR